MTRIVRIFLLTLLLSIGAAAQATLVTDSFDVSFAASQSLWAGGPSFGLDASGTFPVNLGIGTVGVFYDVAANTGTVAAGVSGAVQATYDNYLGAGESFGVSLSFLPGNGNLSSDFGAAAEAGVFISASLLGFGVSHNFNIIDQGFLLDPSDSFVPTLGQIQEANDSATALSVGPNFDFGCVPIFGCAGSIGASLNFDLDQTAAFTPIGLDGMLMYQNQATGMAGMTPFGIASDGSVDIDIGVLTAGIWDFMLIDASLDNVFSNDIDLALSPVLNYVIGSWSPGAISFGLLAESFSLDFNHIDVVGAFSVEVVPIPGAVWLFASAIFGLGMVRRR